MISTFIKHFVLALALVLVCAISNVFANVSLQQFESNTNNKLHFSNQHHTQNNSNFDFCAEEDETESEDELITTNCITQLALVTTLRYTIGKVQCKYHFKSYYTIAPQVPIYLRIRNLRV